MSEWGATQVSDLVDARPAGMNARVRALAVGATAGGAAGVATVAVSAGVEAWSLSLLLLAFMFGLVASWSP